MSETTSDKRHVLDMQGHTYTLTKKLGQGGQGAVWRTTHPKILVKGCLSKDPGERERWVNQVTWLMRQDLTGLPLAKPVALLKPPRVGYIMELMDGLEPLSLLLESVAAQQAQGYLLTGGLSRRLRLLSRLATTLSQLHGRGMAFGDVSPDNIYISAEADHAELWLIDCDNISFTSQPCRTLYTPDYGAPELVRGEADFSTLTDIWSFAVIAYRLLTGNHPLKGDLVNDGDPEIEEAALRGEIPWIGDTNDAGNACSYGIPLTNVASRQLENLFGRCFGPGKTDPYNRPSMVEWLEAIQAAIEHMAFCQDCGSSFLLKKDHTCTFCGAALDPAPIVASELQYVPSADSQTAADNWIQTRRVMVLQEGHPQVIRMNIPSEWHNGNLPPLARVELADDRLWIEPLEEPLLLQTPDKTIEVKRRHALIRSATNGLQAWHYLHMGPIRSPHMVWRFRW